MTLRIPTMHTPSLSFLRTIGLALVAAPLAQAQAVSTVDFGELSLAPDSFYQGPDDVAAPFVSKGVSFPHIKPSWSSSYSDFTYSNRTDTTTGAFTNDSSAFTGNGSGDAIYGIAYTSGSLTATFTQPGGVSPLSIDLTNTTYAALSMLNGDAFSKQFGGVSGNDPDFFVLSITGLDASATAVGTVDFYLSDFRFEDNSLDYVVDTWETVDLTSLGDGITALTFALASSDNGMFGMNTPAYFAFDNLTFSSLTAVPEPSTYALLLGLAGLGFAAWRRRRQ